MLYFIISNSVEGYLHIEKKTGAAYFQNMVNAEEIISFDNLGSLLNYIQEKKFFNCGPLLIEEVITEENISSDEEGNQIIEEIDTITETEINTKKVKKKVSKKQKTKRK